MEVPRARTSLTGTSPPSWSPLRVFSRAASLGLRSPPLSTPSGYHRHLAPSLHDHQSSADSELIPILQHSSLASCMTLSVHWDSEDEEDMSSDQSSMNLKESLSQAPYGTVLTRSLSLSNVVPTVYQQPSVAGRLTSCLSQPVVASKVASNPGHLSMASRMTELSSGDREINSSTDPDES